MIPVRQVLGTLGLLVAVAGVATGSRLVVWIAIVVLGASVALRVVDRVRRRRAEEAEESAPGPPD